MILLDELLLFLQYLLVSKLFRNELGCRRTSDLLQFNRFEPSF